MKCFNVTANVRNNAARFLRSPLIDLLNEAATRRQPKLRCHDLCCIFVPLFSEGLILHTIMRTRQHEHNIFIAIALRPAVPDTSQAPQAQRFAAQTIEAYSRTLRRIGARFDHQIDSLTEAQLRDYFTELVASHAWSVTGCSSSLCIAWGCAWAKGYGCNRHCPHCPHHESQPWLVRQLQKQVPAEYVLLTFTLPAEFRGLARAHQRIIYDLAYTL